MGPETRAWLLDRAEREKETATRCMRNVFRAQKASAEEDMKYYRKRLLLADRAITELRETE